MTNEQQDELELGGLSLHSDINMIRAALGLFGTLGAMAAGEQEKLRIRSMVEARPSLLTPDQASEAVLREVMDEGQLMRELARLGFTDERAGIIARMRWALLDAGTLIELLKRGDIDDATYTRRMGQLGFTADDASKIAGLRFHLPPVQDVIVWMVREVFNPTTRAHFGQDDEFPEDVLTLTRKLGVRDEDMRAYWAAHWQLPSPQQGMEMFQRRAETGVTEEELRTLLKAQDVMPYWRERMIQIAYNPITRVDVRRIHKMGLLDHAGLVDRYTRVGYSPDDAELLAKFTENLNKQEDDALRKADATSLATRLRSFYLNGDVSADELRAGLTDLGYSDGEVTALVEAADLDRIADARHDLQAAIKALYVQAHIDRATCIARLVAAGYAASEAERIAAPWHGLRELRELNDAEKAEKDLTRADVLGAYEDSLISQDEATKHLDSLGYDEDEAKTLLARVDIKKAKARRTDTEASTKALYLARRIQRTEAAAKLVQAGVTNDRANALVETWDAALEAKTPELTVQQISAAYRLGILVREKAAARLDDLGYVEDDREILLALVEKGSRVSEQ